MIVRIAGVGESKILGRSRNLKECLTQNMKETKLALRMVRLCSKWYKPREYIEPKSSVDVDINMNLVRTIIVRIFTRLQGGSSLKSISENLHKKHSKRKGQTTTYRRGFSTSKAKRIAVDFARQENVLLRLLRVWVLTL